MNRWEQIITQYKAGPMLEAKPQREAKHCTKCGGFLPLSEFCERSDKRGHIARCRACMAEGSRRYRRLYAEANP